MLVQLKSDFQNSCNRVCTTEMAFVRLTDTLTGTTDWPRCSVAHSPTSGLDPKVKQYKCATEEEAGR